MKALFARPKSCAAIGFSFSFLRVLDYEQLAARRSFLWARQNGGEFLLVAIFAPRPKLLPVG
jgi:hypothetical protein